MYQCTNFFMAGLLAKASFATVSKRIPFKVGRDWPNAAWYIAADAFGTAGPRFYHLRRPMCVCTNFGVPRYTKTTI